MQKYLLHLLMILSIGTAYGQTDTIYPFDIGPVFTVDPSHNAGCEYYFLSPHEGTNTVDPEFRSILMIADRNGELLFFKAFPGTSNLFYNFIFDFKLQPNGQITYHNIANGSAHFVLDSTLTIVDSLTCKNGLPTDAHELLLTADGYRYNLCYDYRTYNLDTLQNIDNEPMSSQATVEGNVIQIIDPNDQLVYQWSGFEHLDFGDMDYTNLDDTAYVDWMHANSISLDDNGDLVVSIRNFNEVIKISRQDSSIIWRLGGKNNNFAFPDDTLQFTLQHHATVLPNGNISILDNGTYHNPPVARAIEYQLNTANDTASLVWEYRNNIESIALGSHQVLPNGNHLINWGTDISSVFSTPIVETGPNMDELVNIDFPQGFFSYRAFCYDLPWQPTRPEIQCAYDSAAASATLTVADNFSQYYWLQLDDTVRTQVVQSTGDYQIFGHNGFGWVGSETFKITDFSNPCDTVAVIDTTTDTIPDGLISQHLLDAISLYPNPTMDNLYLSVPEGLGRNGTSIHVFNALGQEVLIHDKVEGNVISLSTASLSRGTYQLQLRGEGFNWQGKFVLME